MKKDVGSDSLSALDAKIEAQKLSFAPVMFQAAKAMGDLGILKVMETKGDSGLSVNEIAEKLKLSEYGVDVLLSAGLSIGLVKMVNEKYSLTKMGYFIQNDEMTRVNMNFVHHVCYQAMFSLRESIEEGRPVGLKVFGDWNTIYENLMNLPDQAKKSWFDFDHYYSDLVFPEALSMVFQDPPKRILDIGGNTGKWAISCAIYDPNVCITIVDFSAQLKEAEKNARAKGVESRIDGVSINVLDQSATLPKGCDAIWVSQFMDCFSPGEILKILDNIQDAMDLSTRLYILETFWDRQEYEVAAYSLNATSLYFTCIANGNSRMYHSEDFKKIIEDSGLLIVEEHDHLGVSHTLLVCKKNPKN